MTTAYSLDLTEHWGTSNWVNQQKGHSFAHSTVLTQGGCGWQDVETISKNGTRNEQMKDVLRISKHKDLSTWLGFLLYAHLPEWLPLKKSLCRSSCRWATWYWLIYPTTFTLSDWEINFLFRLFKKFTVSSLQIGWLHQEKLNCPQCWGAKGTLKSWIPQPRLPRVSTEGSFLRKNRFPASLSWITPALVCVFPIGTEYMEMC